MRTPVRPQHRVKPLLLPLCLGLLLLRRWNVLGVAVGVVAVLNLVALAVDPRSLNGMGEFVRGLLTDSGAISGAFFVFNFLLCQHGCSLRLAISADLGPAGTHSRRHRRRGLHRVADPT